ncbi:chorismate-binding protein [Psychroserpens sp. Hel_I_66]|uniref:chorismate-binding protein n=1 Tax=Psychroserpens sp. Hel_I_66 TaxID=1250004 RepID=UPI000647A0D0|nr:chorismate-binding protein [Psychroserpens sp. Hel_I_66]
MAPDEFLNDIEAHFNKNLPFVVYRKPHETLVKSILQKDNTVYHVKDFTESGFVFSPFDSKKETIIFPSESSKISSTAFSFPLENDHNPSALKKDLLVDISEENHQRHLKLVQKGIDAIGENTFEKVVLSRVETLPVLENNPIDFFLSLLQNYATALVYLWYHPKIGLWLGATPETLLKVEGQRFKTMSLAGTRQFDGDENINWDSKNSNEQYLVTNYILQELSPFVEQCEASPVKTIRAGELLHLQSKISGVLKSDSIKDVIFALHPTPAVCGLPKKITKNFILENEGYNREFYTGFLGELNLKTSKSRNKNKRNVENNAYSSVKTTSELFVNLRCMQISKNDILIYVGGGVVKDSKPQKEWEETVAKSFTIKKVILK